MNRHKMAADPRWDHIATIEDAQAILVAIEECSEAIAAHSREFSVRNPVENLYQIQREVQTQAILIDRLRGYHSRFRNGIERSIKND